MQFFQSPFSTQRDILFDCFVWLIRLAIRLASYYFIVLSFGRVTNFSRERKKYSLERIAVGRKRVSSRVELLLREEDYVLAENIELHPCEQYRIAEYLVRDYKTDINVVLWDTAWFILDLD